MHVGILATMSGLSLEATARETHRNQEGEVLRGKVMGGRRYGYRAGRAFDESGKVVSGLYEIVPEEAEVVCRMYREYAAGRSAQALDAGLKADASPGPEGKHWQRTTLVCRPPPGTGVPDKNRKASGKARERK